MFCFNEAILPLVGVSYRQDDCIFSSAQPISFGLKLQEGLRFCVLTELTNLLLSWICAA